MALGTSLMQLTFAEEGRTANLWRFLLFSITLFMIYRVGLIIYRLFFHPLSAYPGSKLWALSDLPFVYNSYISGTSFRDFAEFHSAYGPVVRIGPNRLAMDGSIAWPQVCARRPAGYPEFPKATSRLPKGSDYSIIASPQDVHRRQRRQLGHAFSEAAMREQETLIMRYITLLIDKVKENALSNNTMNIVEWLNFTTFDIIGDLTFGESFGSLENSAYHPWVLSIFKGIKSDSFARACRSYPLIAPLLLRLFGTSAKKGDENRVLAQTKASARITLGKEPQGRRDFMTYMLAETRDGQPGLSHTEIMANSSLLVVAGSETTASALSGFFFYLNQTARAKDIVINEVRNSFVEDAEITMISTGKLQYLHATIEETLRMYPPVTTLPPRLSPGAEIAGTYVPEGTLCYVTPWATFRNPEHFFEPDAFWPERWLGPEHPLYDTRFANDNRSVCKPFSNGPRDCIGKNLAYAEMRLIVAKLLFNFDVELCPGQDDWHKRQRSYTIWEKGPLHVNFSARKH